MNSPAIAIASSMAARKRIGGDTQIRTGDGAFAELCLTTWLCRLEGARIQSWGGWRESNPRVNLGKVAGCHYITPAPQASDAFGHVTDPSCARQLRSGVEHPEAFGSRHPS